MHNRGVATWREGVSEADSRSLGGALPVALMTACWGSFQLSLDIIRFPPPCGHDFPGFSMSIRKPSNPIKKRLRPLTNFHRFHLWCRSRVLAGSLCRAPPDVNKGEWITSFCASAATTCASRHRKIFILNTKNSKFSNNGGPSRQFRRRHSNIGAMA